MKDLKFRHEWKHEISASDRIAIRQRMSAVASLDPHATEGTYFIRSLYFDNLYDTALREKIDGVNMREKFRIRYYDHNTSLIHLEKKSKINGLCNKQSCHLTAEEAQKIVDGDLEWMPHSERALVIDLYSKMKSKGLKPATIVDYTREPFIYGPGNVRVTLDYNIRTGLKCVDFLKSDCITVPAGDAPIILEVKWDEYLPDIIKYAVQLPNIRSSAFSKYAVCRIYG
ncbi:MAG: polyphosphate polymerase domain-containing protein [Lachnospiraceae bacterium]|nr:polyphosphate polymerase domain-containing protein [Lachnospiraceae bacterium]